ncbi:MAG TPA: hypothetical protein VN081_03560 [Dongiaceae bacterium]|nr:hypothetical protein [Dongiaceae bacterium]
MITTLSILGTQVMPFDNVGAGFQMAARSTAGNAYNPTQAGDCNNVASPLNNETIPWSPSDLNLPSANGILFDVTPRNYDGGSTTACLTSQVPLPYTFTFGATLGDGIQIAKQGMIVDMSITRQAGSQPLELNISELPSIYPLASIFPYAYWSANGVTFNALNYNGSNDIHSWPYTQNMYVTGQAVMLCSSGNAICIALYSNSTTQMLISHRQGVHYELGLMTLIAAQSGTISDYNTHTARKILAVGTPATVSAVIAGAKATITNWGDIH